MNKHAKLYRDYIKSLTFERGDCHVCRQGDVKVRQLWCNKHNFCLMCAEFVPRFMLGDFSCKRCPNENKQFTDVTSTQRKPRRRRRYLPTTEIERLMDFDDSDEDNDLEGNNQEWEKLLETLTKPATPVRKPPEMNDTDMFLPKPLPRKPSFLHLSLPSANEDATEGRQLPNTNLICNTVTDLLHSSHGFNLPGAQFEPTTVRPSIGRSNPHSADRQQTIRKDYVTVPVCDVNPEDGSPELERNTSPCKGLRPRSCLSFSDDGSRQLKSPVSENDEFMGLVEETERPEVLSSSSSRSGTDGSLGSEATHKSYDDFWDTKVG